MKYTKPVTEDWNLGVGLVDSMPGKSFQPFDTDKIRDRALLLFTFFIVLPVLVGLAISVLQSVFPWWPR